MRSWPPGAQHGPLSAEPPECLFSKDSNLSLLSNEFLVGTCIARPMCCVFAVVVLSTSSWWRCFVRAYRRWLVRLRPSWRQRILPMSCKQFNWIIDLLFFVDSDLLLLWEWFFISSSSLMQRIIRFKASESHILNANVFRRSAKTDAGLELFYNNLQLFHTACDQTQEFVVPIWTSLLYFHVEFLSVC